MHACMCIVYACNATRGKSVGLKHVHGILFIIDYVFVMLGMCRISALKKQCPHATYRSNMALI